VSTATIDGIVTRYEVSGSGPPLLMYSPGGFDSRLENWSSLGIYQRIGLLAQLTPHYMCITFDRRESGRSGGRVERLGWDAYVRQGLGLLDHPDVDRAHLMGGMVLYSPAGGARYRMAQHARFADHAAFVRSDGLDGVVHLARSHDLGFTKDPRVGPWASVIRTDSAFAESYAKLDPQRYLSTVAGIARVMYDRDTVPGAEPEDLMALDVPALIVPGEDASHATSAARYLDECLPRSDYWDVPVSAQTADTAPARVLQFLAQH